MSPPPVKKEISIKQMSASFVNIYLKICFSLHIPRRISTIEIIVDWIVTYTIEHYFVMTPTRVGWEFKASTIPLRRVCKKGAWHLFISL